MRVGQSAATEGMAFYNAVVPLGETAEFYSFGGLGHRDGLSAGFFRLRLPSATQSRSASG